MAKTYAFEVAINLSTITTPLFTTPHLSPSLT